MPDASGKRRGDCNADCNAVFGVDVIAPEAGPSSREDSAMCEHMYIDDDEAVVNNAPDVSAEQRVNADADAHAAHELGVGRELAPPRAPARTVAWSVLVESIRIDPQHANKFITGIPSLFAITKSSLTQPLGGIPHPALLRAQDIAIWNEIVDAVGASGQQAAGEGAAPAVLRNIGSMHIGGAEGMGKSWVGYLCAALAHAHGWLVEYVATPEALDVGGAHAYMSMFLALNRNVMTRHGARLSRTAAVGTVVLAGRGTELVTYVSKLNETFGIDAVLENLFVELSAWHATPRLCVLDGYGAILRSSVSSLWKKWLTGHGPRGFSTFALYLDSPCELANAAHSVVRTLRPYTDDEFSAIQSHGDYPACLLAIENDVALATGLVPGAVHDVIRRAVLMSGDEVEEAGSCALTAWKEDAVSRMNAIVKAHANETLVDALVEMFYAASDRPRFTPAFLSRGIVCRSVPGEPYRPLNAAARDVLLTYLWSKEIPPNRIKSLWVLGPDTSEARKARLDIALVHRILCVAAHGELKVEVVEDGEKKEELYYFHELDHKQYLTLPEWELERRRPPTQRNKESRLIRVSRGDTFDLVLDEPVYLTFIRVLCCPCTNDNVVPGNALEKSPQFALGEGHPPRSLVECVMDTLRPDSAPHTAWKEEEESGGWKLCVTTNAGVPSDHVSFLCLSLATCEKQEEMDDITYAGIAMSFREDLAALWPALKSL